MANARIDIVGQTDLGLIAGLYNQIFKPTKDEAFFRRRFMGRHNALILIASIDQMPVGFFVGFELKPDTYFCWLFGVLPDFRRQGIASQLLDAVHTWAASRGYEWVRFECHNQHRPMLHLAISHAYDIIGIRWDGDRAANLVIFEKAMEHAV